MGWLASFKGLRRLGVPPVFAAIGLLAAFFFARRTMSSDSSDSVSEPATAAA